MYANGWYFLSHEKGARSEFDLGLVEQFAK